jgi:hypothetical protein
MKEPIRPINRKERVELSSYKGMTLQCLIEEAERHKIDPKDINIEAEIENDWGDEYAKLTVYYEKPESSDEEFSEKLKKYRSDKKIFDKWLKEEFPKIEVERLNKEIAKLEARKAEL